VNSSLTGSLDKVVLEAMAAGRPVLSCNDAFPALVRELGDAGAGLVFQRQDPVDLAQRLGAVLTRPMEERRALGRRLRAIVQRDHEVDALMRRLVEHMGASG
jgi:glycosyltransferase involved in cell wall biosynthesis